MEDNKTFLIIGIAILAVVISYYYMKPTDFSGSLFSVIPTDEQLEETYGPGLLLNWDDEEFFLNGYQKVVAGRLSYTQSCVLEVEQKAGVGPDTTLRINGRTFAEYGFPICEDVIKNEGKNPEEYSNVQKRSFGQESKTLDFKIDSSFLGYPPIKWDAPGGTTLQFYTQVECTNDNHCLQSEDKKRLKKSICDLRDESSNQFMCVSGFTTIDDLNETEGPTEAERGLGLDKIPTPLLFLILIGVIVYIIIKSKND